jgi:hypothetical protein
MKRVRNIIIILLLVGLVVAAVFLVVGVFSPKGAGISIETDSVSMVYINGEQVGRTPYSETREAGEVTIKLIPESFDTPLAPYETKVELISGINTIVRRDFANTEEESSGYVISFEKVGGKETSIAVVSVPDSAEITIDGAVRGFTPLKESSVSPGEHTLRIAADGYVERTVRVNAQEGYKLTVVVKLAPNGESPEEPEEEEPTEPQVEEVEILDTPTGFLRVRSGPSTSFEEVAQVEPGERFPYLETDEGTGWFKIDVDGEEGWVSNQYAEIVEEDEASPSPSPSPES